MKFRSLEFCYLSGISNESKTKFLPSLFGFGLPCFHFLLLWWFFTRKDRGMLELLWRTGERRRRLTVWQRWEGSSGSCWTRTAERLSACSLASSSADGLWSGVRLGSRGGISMDTSVEPITKTGQVRGAEQRVNQRPPTKQVYEWAARKRFKPGGGHSAGTSHKQEPTTTSEGIDRHLLYLFIIFVKKPE